MNSHDTVRIRMLGGWQVLQADGSPVDAAAGRTGKTMDLLRLLALDNGKPVRPEGLMGKPWPDAPPERARASMRSATCQIRRAVGPSCVVRRLGGLVLEDAWVDAVEVFETHRARLAHELGTDPSPQTRELHLRLLRGTAPVPQGAAS
jgi:SARP family transcriptional regulator, regulator of embCAB operon